MSDRVTASMYKPQLNRNTVVKLSNSSNSHNSIRSGLYTYSQCSCNCRMHGNIECNITCVSAINRILKAIRWRSFTTKAEVNENIDWLVGYLTMLHYLQKLCTRFIITDYCNMKQDSVFSA